ncbi:pentapeptide repeat-containing protein [Amycolatopsis keratiniphila]|uniref:pentapeptide repeat-containing protein n=1 Tax=Amycolatopsis keratiniphila TaxID=129921 RepID=UPI001301527A|nr:pentapeptide repeat-containing protein [Amycolatopsis keratiniphila]
MTLVVSVAAGITITVLLWGDTPTSHRDAFDVGWKSSAAVLAILAAFVTVERLRLSQREHHRQLDNDEATQFNTLSSQASEQLGSEKDAVRIGGLTDLERLAEQYPNLRQTVVDRICAYLRAPYQPPPNVIVSAVDAKSALTDTSADQAESSTPGPSDDEIAARRLELDVRRTAQQILHRHLRTEARSKGSPHAFWEKISIDLRDAVLIEIDFNDCQFASADFRNVTVYGDAGFRNARFQGPVVFEGATFYGAIWFMGTKFDGDTVFNEAKVGGAAVFHNATFHGAIWFTRVKFAGAAVFSDATFKSAALFSLAEFDFAAVFNGVEFGRDAIFSDVKCNGEVTFDGARVNSSKGRHEWPDGWRLEQSPLDSGKPRRLTRTRNDSPSERSGDGPKA